MNSDEPFFRADPDRPGVLIVHLNVRQPVEPTLTEAEALDILEAALGGASPDRLKSAMGQVNSQGGWRHFFKACDDGCSTAAVSAVFHTEWSVRSFRIREAVADDDLLARSLRSLLPRYEGAGERLFRGEQLTRFLSGLIGFNWTPDRTVAERFAQGLCATYEGGGVLLEAQVPAGAIIAGPGVHSRYLGEEEFVVDPRGRFDIAELQRFPVF